MTSILGVILRHEIIAKYKTRNIHPVVSQNTYVLLLFYPKPNQREHTLGTYPTLSTY